MLRHLAIVLALSAAACGHSLDNGTWQLMQDGAATTDSCSLLAADGSVLSGTLLTRGDTVRFDIAFSVFGQITLTGQFKQGKTGEPDEFLLEGTVADEPVALDGATCEVGFGHLEVTSTVDDSQHFHGQLDFSTDVNANQDARCPLRCDLALAFRASTSP